MKLSGLIGVLVTATGYYAAAVPFNNTRIGVAMPRDKGHCRLREPDHQVVTPSTGDKASGEKQTVKVDIITHFGNPIVKRTEAPATHAQKYSRYCDLISERNEVGNKLWKLWGELCEEQAGGSKAWYEQCEKRKAIELQLNGTSPYEHRGL